jgi:hypothetical protein
LEVFGVFRTKISDAGVVSSPFLKIEERVDDGKKVNAVASGIMVYFDDDEVVVIPGGSVGDG